MKIAFSVFAATCLISGLTAADLSAFDDKTDLENVRSNFLNVHVSDDDPVKILWPTTAPTFMPTRPTTITTSPSSIEPSTSSSPTSTTPRPTSPTTTSTPRPPRPTTTSTPRPPRPTTTSTPRPPRPTTTTRRPFPPGPPRPTTTTLRPVPPPLPPRFPQIYNGRVNSLGPFAGQLVNLVLNKKGRQSNLQKNQIIYNIVRKDSRSLKNKQNE